MRKLVTVRQIKDITPIPGADFIAYATIDGWGTIIKKSEFKVGDPCLFFEIDSFIPVSDTRFEFLSKTTKYLDQEGYRLKTMRMRGHISQGLALPLSMFPEIKSPESDKDYSDVLKVIKYDVAVADNSQRPGLKSGKPAGKFPSFIPKTDQERIQNLTHLFNTMADEPFEETLKLDGSSMTCYKIKHIPTLWDKFKSFFGFKSKPYHFGVCSRNLEIKPEDTGVQTFNNDGKESVYDKSDFWNAAIKYDIEKRLPVGYAVQGELIGPKIQANHEKVTSLEYYIFDVFDIDKQMYLNPSERVMFCNMYNLNHVPVTNSICYPLDFGLDKLLLHVEGESMNPGTVSEGRVYKHLYKPLTFKAISNKYLLSKGE